MIQNAAFFVDHPVSKFIGIIAYNTNVCSAGQAARKLWGTMAKYQELTDVELIKLTKEYSVFTASYNE